MRDTLHPKSTNFKRIETNWDAGGKGYIINFNLHADRMQHVKEQSNFLLKSVAHWIHIPSNSLIRKRNERDRECL
jgi:hypothetical protein